VAGVALFDVRLRCFTVIFTASVVAVLLATLPAEAKDGVKATLTTAIPLGASQGARLEIGWRLFYLDENGRRQPFDASRVFVRLRSAAGGRAATGFADDDADATGDYHATVLVPEGGIEDVQIGLEGWSSGPSGTRKADAFFPITNDPMSGVRSIASPGASPSGSTAWGRFVVLGGLALLVALGLAFALGRRRRAAARGPRELAS
jgi:hypothetical protein